jgi:transcriptional regulator with XRE-family HTH domain
MELERLVIDNIKRIRKEKGISQEKLAEACNTATSYIGLMEIYKNVPKLSTIERIAKALDIDPLMLFQRTASPSSLQEAHLRQLKQKMIAAIEADIETILQTYPLSWE